MKTFNKAYHSKLYRDFKGIDPTSHQAIVRFFEKHEFSVWKLDVDERFELIVDYTHALFELEAFRKFLLMADVVIEESMMHSIVLFEGKDIYFQTLWKKAFAHYRLLQYDRADYILRELLKMDPAHKDSYTLLRRCLYKNHPRFIQQARAFSIFLFLFSAIITAIELLAIRHFYAEWVPVVEKTRILLLTAGVLLLIGSDLFHRYQVLKEIRGFLKQLSA